MQIDQTQALTMFVGNMPTFLAVVLAWMHSNSRLQDMQLALKAKIAEKCELDTGARLKHLEENQR